MIPTGFVKLISGMVSVLFCVDYFRSCLKKKNNSIDNDQSDENDHES